MNDYQDAAVVAVRQTLADGRTFVLPAEQSEDGKTVTFTAIEDGPRMVSEDFASLVAYEHLDELGRVSMRMAAKQDRPQWQRLGALGEAAR